MISPPAKSSQSQNYDKKSCEREGGRGTGEGQEKGEHTRQQDQRIPLLYNIELVDRVPITELFIRALELCSESSY